MKSSASLEGLTLGADLRWCQPVLMGVLGSEYPQVDGLDVFMFTAYASRNSIPYVTLWVTGQLLLHADVFG